MKNTNINPIAVLALMIITGLICSIMFYNIGTQKIGHNQRHIIAPELCDINQLLKVVHSSNDSLILRHINDTTGIDPVQ